MERIMMSKIVDLSKPMLQKDFAKLVGVSQQAVSMLHRQGRLKAGGTAGEWLSGYISNLREQAAGRKGAAQTDSGLDLVSERARLAKEQADKVALHNAVTRKEYAPVGIISMVLADGARQIVSIMETLPKRIKQRYPAIPAEAMDVIRTSIVDVRNAAANIELDLDAMLAETNNLDEDEAPHQQAE